MTDEENRKMSTTVTLIDRGDIKFYVKPPPYQKLRWGSMRLISRLSKISLIKINGLLRVLFPIQMVTILYSYKPLKKLNRWLSSLYGGCENSKMSILHLSAIDRSLNSLNRKLLTVDLCLCSTLILPFIPPLSHFTLKHVR